MKRFHRFSLSILVVLASVCRILAGDSVESKSGNAMKMYEVNKKVSDFPAGEDLSTPEAAYATIMRDYMATGACGAEWSGISTMKMSGTQRMEVLPEAVSSFLQAHIIEVWIYKERLALVIAEMMENGTKGYDIRRLFYNEERWLNSGQEQKLEPTLDAARKTCAKRCEMLYRHSMKHLRAASRWNRGAVSDPETYIKPYVDFLKQEGRDPHDFMMEAFESHELVTMGEVHHRPRYWSFYSELVQDPSFPENVGTIYMELPVNHQENIDRFLSGGTCEKELVINMLRDYNEEMGWPCQPTLEFFIVVWETNQKLPVEKRLRIRLVDTPYPWEKIRESKDSKQYIMDRDAFMAQTILQDRQTEQGKSRHGFFITGMAHAMEEFFYSDQSTPQETAGWHLKQSLGDQLFTVFQHAPVITNQGKVSGRLALGLIDSAFSRLDDRPVAFMLDKGPFGSLAFDGMPDSNVYGTFRNGFNAYLYLIPLESETYSSLIDGFYSKDFVAEVNRRYQVMYGKPLPEFLATPEGMTAFRKSWGQPQIWVGQLGPENAWHDGDEWKSKKRKEHLANVRCEELTTELDKLFRGIREIDPRRSWEDWERKFGFSYEPERDWPGMYRWWIEVIQKHPLDSVEYGELGKNQDGLPQIRVTMMLQGGITISRVFSFRYDALRESWTCRLGLDLHLDTQWKDFPKTGKNRCSNKSMQAIERGYRSGMISG